MSACGNYCTNCTNGGLTCTICNSGFTLASGSCSCPAGKFIDTNQNCVACSNPNCQPGSFTVACSAFSDASCSSCTQGKFSTSGSVTACSLCTSIATCNGFYTACASQHDASCTGE